MRVPWRKVARQRTAITSSTIPASHDVGQVSGYGCSLAVDWHCSPKTIVPDQPCRTKTRFGLPGPCCAPVQGRCRSVVGVRPGSVQEFEQFFCIRMQSMDRSGDPFFRFLWLWDRYSCYFR